MIEPDSLLFDKPLAPQVSMCGPTCRHPYTRIVQLQNSTRVPARVQALVLDIEGVASGNLVVEPAAFSLPAHGCVEVHLTLTGSRLGPLQLFVSFTVRLSDVTALCGRL